FRCFWSLDAAWGEFVMTPTGAELHVLQGELPLSELRLPFLGAEKAGHIQHNGQTVSAAAQGDGFHFDTPLRIGAGERLVIG
ncbi:MAG: hypothetical protein KDE31_15700, partial [Caldilineaceae bacterium]|nr:hypothetical protein [Caldilineaceae bacterium]